MRRLAPSLSLRYDSSKRGVVNRSLRSASASAGLSEVDPDGEHGVIVELAQSPLRVVRMND